MSVQAFVEQLAKAEEYFNRSADCLQEKDSGFKPEDGSRTAAQQVAHCAQTIDWFLDGVFGANGFDLDFSKFDTEIEDVTSLTAAREWLTGSFQKAREAFGSKTMEELSQTLPEGPVMGGAPRLAAVSAIVEHTAHHRGALTVYSRLAGYTPNMPYM